MRITAQAEGFAEPLSLNSPTISDRDGRFVFNYLMTGCKYYTLMAYDEQLGEWTYAADKVQVTAGQTIDLGDIKLKPKP